MEFENDLRFRLLILKRYLFDYKRYSTNRQIRNFYLKKYEDNNLKTLKEIISFCRGKNIDSDRFYYIHWQMADCLYDLERYDESSTCFKIAIDNVITKSYKKNKFKLKSKHYDLFLREYEKAIDCFIKAGKYNEADYYDNLNMYREKSPETDNEKKGDFYASHGAKKQAIKYYERKISEIQKITITRQYDYDPYTDGYLEEKYKKEIKEKHDAIKRIYDKIDLL